MTISSFFNTAKKCIDRHKRVIKRAFSTPPKLKYYYEIYCQTLPVNDKLVLIDSFNGRGFKDSPYAVLEEMVAQGLGSAYDIVFTSRDLERDRAFIRERNLPVRLVNHDGRAYPRILATAGHLITNTGFPTYFIRRPGQIVVDTWHGVPLKTLGKRMSMGMHSMFYAQHTFMQCSWLTFPNDFTRDVMMRDYNIEQLYTGKVAMVGYPRNTVLLKGRDDKLRATYDLDGYTNFAYMPTWRGTTTKNINIDEYAAEALGYLKTLDSVLSDDQRMFVNFHPIVADAIKMDSLKHIMPFPPDVNNYEFLSQMDGLVTDYSSVMFDYALLRRPIILFTYDEADYLHDRGLYIPLADLPFKKADTIEELEEIFLSRSYEEQDEGIEEFYEEFIKYDSIDNTKKVVKLLLDDDPGDLTVIDYSGNKERTWNVVDAVPQRNPADLNGIFLSSDKEHDIILLAKAGFSSKKSRHVADNYLDGYNFFFVTEALPRTPIEAIGRRFSDSIEQRLAERERKRILGDLPTNPIPRTSYVAGVAGSSYKMDEYFNLNGSYHMVGERLSVSWNDEGYLAKAILLVSRRNIRWVHELTAQEQADSETLIDLAQLGYDSDLKANNGTRARVCLLVEDPKASTLHVTNLIVGDGTAKRSTRYCPPVVIASNEETLAPLRDEVTNKTGIPLLDKARDQTCVVVAHENDSGMLALFFTYEQQVARSFSKPVIIALKTPNEDHIELTIRVNNGDFQIESIELRNRLAASDTVHPMEYTVTKKDNRFFVDVTFNPKGLEFDGLYWDVFVVVSGPDGKIYDLDCVTRKQVRRSLYFRNYQCNLGDGNILFPYFRTRKNQRGQIAFCHRMMYPSDTIATKIKEWLALIVYTLLKPYWNHKRTWLVYEKFCSLAEDNGYAFFRYCMEDAPKEARKHVYYVIKKNEPEYANVERYGKNVIDFMSFRHILYLLAADILIGSDAKSHLYQWRPKTSIVKKRLDKKKVFFLQHGVTAMKRVDYLFGTWGISPMTYFLTTSRKEQDIVVENFGYRPRFAPILGFSRWDVLENHANPDHPTILLMPTWRQWLEDVGEEAFTSSDYYNAYAGLIQDERLHKLLEQANATLKFFIHPKLSNELRHFSASSDRVELIEMGSAPLNQIIMECSALITDYSSVAWDVIYMDKPALFYQFDQDLYISEVGSYINLNTELPGPICKDLDQLIAAFETLVQSGFTMSEEDEIKLKGWYESKDSRNRERTYKYLVSEGY